MAQRTASWYQTVHSFLDEDLKTLVELGIKETATLTLLSEYVILMFDDFYVRSQQMKTYSTEMNRAEYTARTIWVALQIHQDMNGFSAGGKMKHNSTLSSAFIRFLTAATAANSATTLASKLTTLDKVVRDANLKDMRQETVKARTAADKALNEVGKANAEIAKLKKK